MVKKSGNYASKISIISPEEIDLKTTYTFSVNLCDDFQHWSDADRVEKFVKSSKLLLKHIAGITKFQLRLEISRTGRLHWHGTIRFINYNAVRTFFVDKIIILMRRATVEIDTCQDPTVWDEYCSKSKHLFNIRISESDCGKLFECLSDPKGVKYLPFPLEDADRTDSEDEGNNSEQ